MLTAAMQADVDHLPAIQAILQGLKIRYDKTGQAAILIHTVSQNNPTLLSIGTR